MIVDMPPKRFRERSPVTVLGSVSNSEQTGNSTSVLDRRLPFNSSNSERTPKKRKINSRPPSVPSLIAKRQEKFI